MATITIEVPAEVAERLGARAEGGRSVEQWLGELAEREADVDESRRRRFHGLIQEGCDSPRRTPPDDYFAGRKATLGERVARHLSAFVKWRPVHSPASVPNRTR